MKLVNPSNPVTSAWLAEQGFRLDPAPYLSGAQEAKKLLERLSRTDKLSEVTAGHNGGIFNGPKFSRIYLHDPKYAVPFLGSADMMEADFSFLPQLSKKVADKMPYLEIEPGMTLVSCSGTIGRMTYVRSDMKGIWSSQHVMKVAPRSGRMLSGYLYTFLRSPYGVPMIASSAYGAIIQHIEPHHIAGLPVPRFGEMLEQKIHDLVEEASRLRTAFQAGAVAATEDFFQSVGLPELNDLRWHQQERDLDFSVKGLGPMSLRAMNYARRASAITAALKSVESRTLGDICEGGLLSTGPMFKRIDSDYEHGGTLLVGQRQGWWNRPEDGRVLSRAHTPKQCFVPDETVMVGAQGLPSENGLLGRAMMVTGRWLPHAYSQHFLRISSGPGGVSGAFLFSFLRSEAALRVFRTMMAGSGPQSLHRGMLRTFPIPLATAADRERIAETVRQAYRDRDQADVLEDQALALLTEAIEKEAAV
ncbi:restriction endonuclease subunit S [Streptomyces anulatus]|uniref:methylation-associated defense system restriction endonuclease subunit S MAD5 n=1 Tax=Streptomyces anulatus TaxID=1892 RepID=UPI0022573EC0|nr:restriction endonuclease subunit S [Streptomyces anulatus]MCX4488867.1 restriction endonuclease subunit S [Streptomyces anulatus]